MACGHCRRPRKEIVAFNLDQLCGIRGLSSSLKSKGLPKVVLRGSKMAPGIGSWDSQNSPSCPEAHPGRGLALPAPRKAPGSVRAAADCTSPGGRPGGPTPSSVPQPPSPPSPLENISLHYSYYLFPSFSTTPHARRGRRIRDGLRPLPPTPKRNLGLQLRSTLLDPRLVELSEEPSWVESSASRVENGTRNRFLGAPNSPSRPEAHPVRALAPEVAWLFENYKVFSRSN